MTWLKKADELLNFDEVIAPPLDAPSVPMTEKEDVATAEDVVKKLKALIAREKKEKEAKEVKLLEDALKSVEKFLKSEKEEVAEEEQPKPSEE